MIYKDLNEKLAGMGSLQNLSRAGQSARGGLTQESITVIVLFLQIFWALIFKGTVSRKS
jgi:hypothetical protein